MMTYVVDNRYRIADPVAPWSSYFFWWFINSPSFGNYTDYCYRAAAYRQEKDLAAYGRKKEGL